MKSIIARTLGGALIAMLATGAMAQQSTNRVTATTDWSGFVEDNPTQCWAVSAPKVTLNTRDGRPVAVKRSDILLFVTFIPSLEVSGEVSFTGGYPFAPGSQLTLEIDGKAFQLFTDTEKFPEMAWAPSKSDDAKIIAAMKRGSKAIVTGRSARGTVTKDTFSLLGFTAVVEEAAKRCSN